MYSAYDLISGCEISPARTAQGSQASNFVGPEVP
jgi:hypothetical protein